MVLSNPKRVLFVSPLAMRIEVARYSLIDPFLAGGFHVVRVPIFASGGSTPNPYSKIMLPNRNPVLVSDLFIFCVPEVQGI